MIEILLILGIVAVLLKSNHDNDDHNFWSKYIFSQDHKVIGIQYGITALLFLLLGFFLMMIMRWQMAYPGTEIPIVGFLFEGKILNSEMYNALGAMHGTIMVFLAVVPLVVGAFGNYCVPLQIGAPDMAYPKLNMASYWIYFVGGIVMLAGFLLQGNPDLLPEIARPTLPSSGWTSYATLSIFAGGAGQTIWLIGMIFLITSSLLGSVNIIVTIIQLRAPGLTWMRLPFFVWAQIITSFLLVLAFPPLEAAGFFQLLDRVAGTSIFMPPDLIYAGESVDYAGGGSPLLWQHLFWFLAHPEVYVLILPAMGIVAEIIANNIRKPLWGYKLLVYSAIFLGFTSFIVWAHHMFMTGMGETMSVFFAITTMIISVPSVIILTCLILSLYGGSMRFNTPMLFAISFLPMFGIGGLTGLPLGLPLSDIHLHDTYYVIGHFHYVVAPGTIFAIFAGIYFWFPKVTGKKMNESLGKIHWFFSFIFMNCMFFPMLIAGLGGMLRRGADGGVAYAINAHMAGYTEFMSWSAWMLGLAQIPFIINFVYTIVRMRKENPDPNPWKATTLEWTAAPSPPVAHGNFPSTPSVVRGAYEYSVPGEKSDYLPQNEDKKKKREKK